MSVNWHDLLLAWLHEPPDQVLEPRDLLPVPRDTLALSSVTNILWINFWKFCQKLYLFP